MEKQRTKCLSGFRKRLLILLFVALMPLYALHSQQLTAVSGSQDTSGAQGLFYTNTDIEFRVFLAGSNAADISAIDPQDELIKNAIVRAIKKTGDTERKGTWIYVWYQFEKAGTYTLPDLLIKEKGRTKHLAFKSVKIEENPLEKLPRIVIVFQNGKRIYSDKSESYKNSPVISAQTGTGQSLKFTVYAQYALSINSFEWKLPQNALFSKTKDYESQDKHSGERGGELSPLADFEWKSLKSGIQTMPRIKMNLTAFSGQKIDVIFPEFSVRFKEGRGSESDEKDLHLFDDAFSLSEKEDSSEDFKMTADDCRTLALLYRAEAKSIIFRHKNASARRNFEKEHGITSWLNRRIYKGDFGISLGCTLFSIPEEGASEVSYIKSGNALEVKEKAGNWIYVKFGETEGWCKKDEVIVWTWETF